MTQRRLHTAMRILSRPLIVWLVLAIAAYGPSSTLLQLLGPAHRHEAAAQAGSHDGLQAVISGIDGVFRDVRAWRAQLEARWLGASPAHAHGDRRVHVHRGAVVATSPHRGAHHYTHAAYHRHHHDPTDSTVVALDGSVEAAASGASSASTGSATLPLALAASIAMLPPAVPSAAWPPMCCGGWVDAVPLPLERPPRV
jgi:hypothetical protein